MLSYYRPGLDVSKLNDKDFIKEVAHLLRIRELEHLNKIEETFKNIFQK